MLLACLDSTFLAHVHIHAKPLTQSSYQLLSHAVWETTNTVWKPSVILFIAAVPAAVILLTTVPKWPIMCRVGR